MRTGAMCLMLLAILSSSIVRADDTYETKRSLHVGFLHPSGVDLLGYTVEKKTADNLYWYYTFGLPSVAAIGFTYHAKYDGNGMTGTLGAGLATHLYASLAYQLAIGRNDFLKLGAGFGTGLSDEAGPYPVISYERRF